MTIEEAIRAKLLADSPVAALVGTRVYPNVLPQSPTYPAIVFERLSSNRQHSQSGASGLSAPRFAITCIAATYAAAKDLAGKVRVAIDGRSETWGGVSGVEVQASFVEDDDDGYDDEFRIYWVALTTVIWFTENTT